MWTANLSRINDTMIELTGVFSERVEHPDLGIIRPGTLSYEYYWLDRWYNVFRFHNPDGGFRNFYVNVNMPPILRGNTLNYVDLDIDMIVWSDFSFEVLDLDEFEENAVKYNYPDMVIQNARATLNEVKLLIERREFPFDHKVEG
jgi:protein associated with RNAse G/E